MRSRGLSWQMRCIRDLSDEENSPPNVQRSNSPASSIKTRGVAREYEGNDLASSTGTSSSSATSPQRSERTTRIGALDHMHGDPAKTPTSSPVATTLVASPTTSSPVLIDSPPSPLLRAAARARSRLQRRESSAPYARRHSTRPPPTSPTSTPPRRTPADSFARAHRLLRDQECSCPESRTSSSPRGGRMALPTY